jgi:uncharacterized repeat protein (TIGR01451 family)
MRIRQLLITAGLGLALGTGLLVLIGRAAPGNPQIHPVRNSHTAPLTTTISITYDEPISPATVTSRTFAVHGMQSGLVTATHSVSGSTIIVTPTQPFHQGELVYAIATTGTANITGTQPLSSTQWQFRAGQAISRCFGRFSNIGVGLMDVYDSSVAWGDYDNDGDLDILLMGYSGSFPDSNPVSRIYRNDGGNFIDIDAGLTDVGYGAAAWGDYDNDGDLDILLTGSDHNDAPVSQVYRNDGGSFIDIDAGLVDVYHSSVAWGDYDNDGDLDILLTGWSSPGDVSHVYRNDAGIFSNIGAGLAGVAGGSAVWGDYDNDSDLDILLTGTFDDLTPAAQVYRNDSGSFTEIGAGLAGVSGSSAAWGDYDDDGDLDILLAGYTGSEDVSRVYRNDDGSFTDINAGLVGVFCGSVSWGDYDNDGDLDILLTGYYAGSRVSKVYENEAGSFTDIDAGLVGVFRSSVSWGDYDNDGDSDILLTGSTSMWPYTPASWIYRNDDYFPDLGLVKAITAQVTGPGDSVTYTLSFFNNGPLTATHVIITDVVPISVTVSDVVSSGVTITDTGASPPYVWQVQDLVPDEGGVITITGVLGTGLPVGFTFTNTAVITTPMVDVAPANNSSSVGVTVSNAAPVAVDDSDSTDEDTPIAVAVLSNDSDANGDTLSISGVGTPSLGSATISGTTQVIYSPTNRPATYTDIFTYTAADTGGLTDTATVTITVTADYDGGADLGIVKSVAPITAEPGGIITYTLVYTNNGQEIATGVIITDTVAVSVTNPSWSNSGATVNLRGGTTFAWDVHDLPFGAGGLVTITGVLSDPLAAGTFTNTAEITTTATDSEPGDNSAGALVTILEIPPNAVDDEPTVQEDSDDNNLDVLTNDGDPNGDCLTVTALGTPDQGGTVVDGGTMITYSPAVDFYGAEVFTYTVSDGHGGFATAAVTVTVSNLNDDPGAVDDTPTVEEDSNENILDVLANDTYLPDPVETLTIVAVGTPDVGGTVVNGSTMITYTPASDFFGTEVFTYTVSDGNGGFATATVTVTVSNLNDDPSAVDDTPTVEEDSNENSLDVLANDTYLPDPVETLTIVAVGTPDQDGTVANGGTVVTYRPAADFYGAEVFTYTVSDGHGGMDTATVTVTVNAVNDVPAFTSAPVLTATEGEVYTYHVTASDPDADDVLTIIASLLPGWLVLTDHGDGTATLAGTPGSAHVGDHAVELEVEDTVGATSVQPFAITVSAVETRNFIYLSLVLRNHIALCLWRQNLLNTSRPSRFE